MLVEKSLSDKMVLLIVFLFGLVSISTGYALNSTTIDAECLVKKYAEDKIVCVCNSEHCDYHVPDITQGKVNIFSSTKIGARYFKTNQELEDFSSSDEMITIDKSRSYQSIIGWGGALTDSTGINVNSLPQKTADELMRSYFTEGGLMYNLCRVPMGGTDFSTHGYSYDDGSEDEALVNFSLTAEDFEYKIPLMKVAQNLSQEKIKFFTAAWTAPKWMKTNGEYYGFGGKLKEKFYQTWANYFLEFLRAYKKEELNFWALSTGNEPSLAIVPFVKINTVGWNSDSASLWIRENLGPTLRKSEFSDIKILAIDDQRSYFPGYVSEVMKNNSTRNYIDGFAVHWYHNFLISANVLSKTNEKFPDKFILATEASNGFFPFSQHVDIGSWERGEKYAVDIIDNLNNWVTGWVDWNMALNLEGGPTYMNNFVDAAILVNTTSGEFYKQPMFYAIGHFSKFIPENSVRIDVSSNLENLQVVGFVRPDSNNTVLVILNKSEQSKSVSVKDGTSFININLEAKSISTIVY